jgi:4-amino-4-deoxy-L-arabinose transferase-like glycosyltransferase
MTTAETHIPKRPFATTLTVLALWIIFYASFTLLKPALLDDADSVHAEVAREMLLRHDWVTLYANGIRYLEKAPLLYWSMAASFRLFGVGTAAARIPLALTVLALALALEAFARRAFRSARAGLYAALILLSSPGIFLFTRITIPDAMVCLWLTLAMLAFWQTESTPNLYLRWSSVAFAACCALGVLTKGLIGLVFPIVIVAIYLLLTRGLRGGFTRIRQLHPLSSLAVFFAIAAPWHFLIALANTTQGHPGDLAYAHGHWQVPLPTDGNVHGWAWFYFVNEQLLRYLNLRVPRDYDTVPLWLFWGLIFIWLMPWSAFLFRALTSAWTGARHPERSAAQSKDPDKNRSNPVARTVLPLHFAPGAYALLLLWAAVPLLFFSVSTRQEYYVLPSLPAFTLLLADWFRLDQPADQDHSPFADKVRRANLRITTVVVALGAIFAAAALYLLLHTGTPAPHTDLAALLQQNPGDYAMSMGHFMDLNAQALGLFRLPLAIAALSLFPGPLASYILRRSAQPHAATLALAAGAFGFLFAAHLGLQTFAPVLSSQRLAAAIAPQVHSDDLIIVHQEYEYASTLGFYLLRPTYAAGAPPARPEPHEALHILEGRSSNLWYGSFFPDAPKIFETPETLAQKWLGPQRIFLWQDLGNQPSPMPALPGAVYVIAKSGGKEIVSNRPSAAP